MSRQARNVGGVPGAVIPINSSSFSAEMRSPLTMRLILNFARLPDWLHFDLRDLSLAFTFAAAATVINMSASLSLLSGRSLLEIAEFAGNVFFGEVLVAVVLVAALETLERIPIHGWRRHLATIATGMAATVVMAGPTHIFEWPFVPSGLTFGVTSTGFALLLYTAWANSALALIARAWLVKSRDETHATNLLARIRSEQTSVRRRLVEGRLKSIQARVDPVFFFDMLEAVQKTYSVDPTHAEQLLDELTAFLRAALPRLRTASSSVDQECELASSFARLRALAGLGTSRVDVDIAPSVGTASFPPGVLLPLIDELLSKTATAGSVDISFSTMESPRQTLVMQLTAWANLSIEVLAAPRPTLLDVLGATADARATLLDLFGASADLTSAAIDGGVRTTVRIPYEPVSA